MQWVERRREAYRHPDGVMPGTRSVIMAAMNYNDGAEPAGGGRVARYAWGSADYHDVLKPRLLKLADLLRSEVPTARTRVVIDTAPLLERDFGRLAGIGWFGKNTMLISRTIGSWFVLGAVLTDVELAYDKPVEQNYCGSCTRCLDACPTDAFPEPGVLDARRCISYLTIELKGSIPVEFRPLVGNRIYGCDDCQMACPWNSFSKKSIEPDFAVRHGLDDIALTELFGWSNHKFNEIFLGSAVYRIGYEQWLRNVAVALGNAPSNAEVLGALQARAQDTSVLVREHVAWAIKQHASR